MKKIACALAVFLLILFVPVFGCVIFIGNKMDYYEEHKITALYSNPALFFCAVLAALIVGGTFFLLRKIPSNKYTMIGTVIFSAVACFLFYILKVEISKCIAFYGGWDCGMVANSARWVFEGKDIGYDDYYYVFSNNVPITWLLYVLYQFSNALGNYPYNPEFIWIQFQCLMFALSVFFAAMTVLLIKKKAAPAILSLLIGMVILGICPWQIIPYTDASTVAASIMVVFLYALFRNIKSKWRYAIWFLMIFAGAIGGIMKATSYVALIAVILTDCLWLFFEKESRLQKIRELAFRAVLLAVGCILASWCRSGMYKAIDYVPDYDAEMTWTNLLYDGLNETSTGACSGDGLNLAREYAGYPRKYRQSIELHSAWGRVKEKGFGGLLHFWLRKQVMNFNDGTFSWFQEGWFNAWEYENITDSRFKEPLRSFYWEEGTNYLKFTTWSQGVWIFVLVGIILEAAFAAIAALKAKDDTEELCLRIVNIVTFIGVFLFIMLFEGRARYLLNNVPIFVTMAALGYSELFQINWLDKGVKLVHRIAGIEEL